MVANKQDADRFVVFSNKKVKDNNDGQANKTV